MDAPFGGRAAVGIVLAILVISGVEARGQAAATQPASGDRLNVLFITADDMNYDSPGVYGNRTPDITPNLDRLAAQSMRFVHAHVTAAVCQPSRSALMTGRYPCRNGAMGFQPINRDVPTLTESLRRAGYLNGIFGKNSHLAPADKFCWDVDVPPDRLGQGRSPERYYEEAKAFFAQARETQRPFFLMANSQDPHRPFAGSAGEQAAGPPRARRGPRTFPPARRHYQPDEVQIPCFLPDLPDVRRELAQYYSSVYRCDETVGELLRALHESGFADRTIVVFLSDNGMSFPYSKTNCYLASTRTPWLVRWPGRVRPGSIDAEHLISGIDFMPTILEALDLPPVPGMDGRSFLPVLRGEKQDGRQRVFTVFHRTSAGQDYPMRCLQDRRYGYLYNAWSDGERAFRNEAQSGLSFPAMRQAAETDKAIAARVRLFLYRVPEEFYDFEADPCALRNLIAEPEMQDRIRLFRAAMLEQLVAAEDPLTDTFRQHLRQLGAAN